MAMDLFSLVGKIAVEYSDAEKSIEKIVKAADDAADSLEDVDDAADDAGESIDDVGDSADDADDKFSTWKVTLANLASQAITALISKCSELAQNIVDLGVDTETAFAQLETIAGTENIDSLKKSISELSEETGVSSSELAIVAYNAISAGASASEASEMVEAATKLATAGFTDADSALSVLSTAMNSYGDAAGTATEISDSLIMVQNLGVTTIGSLSSAMGKAIATGSAYGVSLGNIESGYVSLTKAGISTEESTTYLNSMMNELGDTGSDVAAIIQEQTGQSFADLMNNGYSLSDVLGILYDSVDGDSTALMNLWSSAEAGKASNAIVNQGLEQFNENLNAIENSSGATETAYATMSDTTQHKIDVMKTNFEELGLKIYNGLEKPLNSAISFVTNTVIPAVETLIDNLNTVAPIFMGIATAVGAFVIALNFSSIVSTVTGVLSGLKTAVLAVNAAMAANPIMLIVSLIAGLVVALVTLWNTNEDFRNAVIAIWESVKEAFATAIEAVKGVISGLVESIGSAFQSIWETITNIFSSVVETLSTAWETIKDVVQVGIMFIVELITEAFELITLPFQFIWENCKEYILAAWEAIKTAVSNALNAISTTISNVWNAIVAFLSPILEGIKNTFTTIWNAIKTTITNVVNAIKTTISNVFNAVKTTVTNILNSIKTTFSNVWNSVKTTVSNVVNGVKSTISSGLNSAKSTVSSILESIKSKFSSIFEGAKTIVSNAINKIKSFFNFSWSLPSLKLPHFSISGSFSLSPPSVPHFSIDWYKKAMEDGMVMNQPTIFGYNAKTNQFMAGGEAGSETVVGTDSLMEMIMAAVSYENQEVIAALERQTERFMEIFSQYFPMFANMQLVTDTGALVGEIAPAMDEELGLIAMRKGR